jgi:catechol 2,3-dioxygenase-like lactoylglutathione lyase family enzyme
MTTIDHPSLGVPDVPAARSFYATLLSTLGVNCLAEGEGFAAPEAEDLARMGIAAEPLLHL